MPQSALRYGQLSRVLKILNLLENSHYGKSLADLRHDLIDYLGLSRLSTKTVSRDLKFLQDAGFHIAEDTLPSGKVWKLENNHLRIPTQDVSVMELLALAVGRELLNPLAGTPYWTGIETFWNRIRTVLPAETLKLFERQWPGLIIRSPTTSRYQDKDGMLSSLNRAIFEHRVLELVYRRPVRGRETRIIEPHALILYQGSLLILATQVGGSTDCSYRQFKLDRILKVRLLDQRFTPPVDYDPRQLFASSIGVWIGGETKAFRIRFTVAVAQWVVETPFHGQQIVQELPDGSLEVSIPSAYETEIISRVLSLGENAEILEPQSCRDAIRDRLQKLVGIYQVPPLPPAK